jgi:hypothetical protein
MNNPHPIAVRRLRIHLANNYTITPDELTEVAGRDLATYMVQEGIPKSDLDEELGDYWICRDLAKWMRDHPKLNDLYVQGKAIKNPSGRTCETNQGYRPGRI